MTPNPARTVDPSPRPGAGRAAVVALAVFTVAMLVSHAVYTWNWLNALPRALSWLVQPLLAVLLVAAGLALVSRGGARRMAAELGLARPFVPAVLFALLATLPLAIGFGLGDDPLANFDGLGMVFTVAVWPLMEELLFRGYAFRQLHRRAGWGFASAALVPPLIFGLIHVLFAFFLDQNLRIPLLAAGASLLGGLFFSWLFVAWGDNLWVPAAFHGLANFWWEGFGIDRTGIGGWGVNALRLAAVVLAVVLTLVWSRMFSAAAPAAPVPGQEPARAP